MKNPYFLLIFPRLLMTLLSFVTDYCLYKICLTLNESYISRLTILSSSYVILVHCTRTLSNSIETALVSFLLYRVSSCMELSNKVRILDHYFNFVLHSIIKNVFTAGYRANRLSAGQVPQSQKRSRTYKNLQASLVVATSLVKRLSVDSNYNRIWCVQQTDFCRLCWTTDIFLATERFGFKKHGFLRLSP